MKIFPKNDCNFLEKSPELKGYEEFTEGLASQLWEIFLDLEFIFHLMKSLQGKFLLIRMIQLHL